MNQAAPDTNTLRLIARVLTLHYLEGQLQSEIAGKLDLSTAKVNRLIKQGRALGMIEFTVNSPFQRLFDLEQKLKERWPGINCIVVDSVSGNAEITLDRVGQEAASHLQDIASKGCVIGISGGKALSAVADNLDPTRQVPLTIVPLTGGVQGQHYTDVNHIATRLAEGIGGAASLIHAPLHADSKEERDMLMSVRSVKEVMDHAQNADIALLGIGSVMGEDATYYTAHPIEQEDRARLYQSGVRAEFLGNLIDAKGQICANDLNSKLVGLPLCTADKIPIRIGVVSGLEKVEPICAVLNGNHVTALVIDDMTAKEVLKSFV